jgi:endonuclease/exonuclease/phosphatase family metal-dependent hydrolase
VDRWRRAVDKPLRSSRRWPRRSDDTVLGGDFNTWLGSREPALKCCAGHFRGDDRATTTWKGPLGLRASLDHLASRRARLLRVARLPDRLGSDHYPVMGIIEF